MVARHWIAQLGVEAAVEYLLVFDLQLQPPVLPIAFVPSTEIVVVDTNTFAAAGHMQQLPQRDPFDHNNLVQLLLHHLTVEVQLLELQAV